MALDACRHCEGLIPARARVCPHCDRPCGRRGLLARALGLAAGGVAAVTLMACYGGPAYYDDCLDQDGDGWFPACYGPVCDPELDPNCDCDDGTAGVYPGAPDPFGDGIDQDCSGADGPGKHRIDAGPGEPVDAAAAPDGADPRDASPDADPGELDAGPGAP